MKRLFSRFLFPSLLIFCFPILNPSLYSIPKEKQASKQSYYLQKALLALQDGKLKRSHLLVRVAKKEREKSQAKNHAKIPSPSHPKLDLKSKEDLILLRLEAMLNFFLEGALQAELKLLDHFEKAPSAAFAYFLGNSFLEASRFQDAVFFFEKSSTLFEEEKDVLSKERFLDLDYALAPSLCVQRIEELEKYRKKSWATLQKKESAIWLWKFLTQAIAPEQRALALYQAYIFTPRSQKKKRKKLLLLLRKTSHYSLKKEKSLLELFRKPKNQERHGECIAKLEKLREELRETIKSGSNIETRANWNFIEKHLSRAYYRQFLLLNNSQAAYAYGRYLIEASRPSHLGALHVLRRALELIGSNLYDFQNNREKILELEQVLQALHKVYKYGLRRRQDAQFLSAILKIISKDSPLASSSIEKETPIPSQWLRHFYAICRSSLYNREALVFLLSHARHIGSPKQKFYQRKLIQRDRTFAEQELSAGFKHLGLGAEQLHE